MPFFGINDDMAIGAIEAIKEKRIENTGEVAVFGFSNSKRSRYMTLLVSTINQFPEKIGETGFAELLFEQIRRQTCTNPRRSDQQRTDRPRILRPLVYAIEPIFPQSAI